MNPSERIRLLVAALPSDDSSVTFTGADLAGLMVELEGDSGPEATRDLTVSEVAAETQRAESTVRGWLISKQLRGYKLNGRDWRVTRAALPEFLEAQSKEPERESDGLVDIAAWRRTVAM